MIFLIVSDPLADPESEGPVEAGSGISDALEFVSTGGLGVSGIISFDISSSPDVFNVSFSPGMCCDVLGLVGSEKSLPAPPGKAACLMPGCIVRVGLSNTAGYNGGVSGI